MVSGLPSRACGATTEGFRSMQLLILCAMLSTVGLAAATATTAEWPQWRGPYNTGMASGGAPLRWDDNTNIRWKLRSPAAATRHP